MNYNDRLLENKAFTFFKQLIYNIALSVLIILLLAIILVYGFKFELYEVLSDSQYPFFKTGDMVVSKAQDKYEVGDILTFKRGNAIVTHRLVWMGENNGKTYYLCHGDNNQGTDPDAEDKYAHQGDPDWEIERLKGMTYSQVTNENYVIQINVDIFTEEKIVGKVLTHFNNYGTYFKFIQGHKLLVITLVVGVWCISGVVQNEMDIKRMRRLEA